jgi:hypothetical protein
MKRVVFFLTFIACSIPLHGETRLGGEIQASSLDATGNPYIVEKDIVVPSGKQLLIKDGCVFLFNQFTGLNVSGDLSVEGSSQRPVIFTCVNDNDFNPKSSQLPNPFDWNGIIVAKESGSVHLQNFQLRYSVYGIKAQNPSMTIQNGLFRQNGQFHFTMNDKIQYVQDNISYSFNATLDSGEVGIEKPSHKKASKTRNIIRYSCLGLGVVGVVAGTVFAVQAYGTSYDYNHKVEKNLQDTKDKSALSTNFNKQIALTTVFYILGGLGLGGFTATFFF